MLISYKYETVIATDAVLVTQSLVNILRTCGPAKPSKTPISELTEFRCSSPSKFSLSSLQLDRTSHVCSHLIL